MEEKRILVEQSTESPTPEKKTYTPPELTVYGKISDMTMGGTGLSLESGQTHSDKAYQKP